MGLTPFCSCSSIPIFIGFTKLDCHWVVTPFSFSYLHIPIVDLASHDFTCKYILIGSAIAYVVFGLVIAVFGGSMISLFKMEKYVESFIMENRQRLSEHDEVDPSIMTKRKEFHIVLIKLKKSFIVYGFMF